MTNPALEVRAMERNCARILHGITAALALATVPTAYAQSTSGTVRTTIIPRLSLSKTADIDFGQIMASSTAPGSVTVTPSGLRTAGGGATLAGGAPSAGEFIGIGTDNQIVVFAFGAPSVLLTRVTGPETMTADSFTLGATTADGLNSLGNSGRWRISANNGQFRMPVGATLRVGAGQVPGEYAGTFTLTAVYQ